MAAAERLAEVAEERAITRLWQHLGSAYAADSVLYLALGAELGAEGADGWNGGVEAWEECCKRVVDR